MGFYYAAKSWNSERHVIAKLEVTSNGPSPRFNITNLPADAQYLYDTFIVLEVTWRIE